MLSTRLKARRCLAVVLFIACMAPCITLIAAETRPAQAEISSSGNSFRSTVAVDDKLTEYRLSQLETQANNKNVDLDKLKERANALEGRTSTVELVGTIAGIFLAIAGLFGWTKLRSLALKSIAQTIQPSLEKTMQESQKKINDVLRKMAEQAESEVIRVVQFLSLYSSNKHDEALAAINWSDDSPGVFNRYRDPSIRRPLIECLLESKVAGRRAVAWALAKSLADEDSSSVTMQLLLRVALRVEQFEEAIRLFERLKGKGTDLDSECVRRAIPLYRRLNQHHKALKLIKEMPEKERDSISTANAHASLLRDLGKFEKAHGILFKYVKGILNADRMNLPAGWKYVVNSYIACAVDRDHPSDAVEACELLVDMEKGAVSLYTAVRLLTRLPKDHPRREPNLKKIADALNGIPSHHQAIMCHAVLLADSGRLPDAIKCMEGAVNRMAPNKPRASAPGDLYFARCLLGRLLREQKEHASAIAVLLDSAADSDSEGEARYELAVTYAEKGDAENAANWLRKAIGARNAWAIRAKNNSVWAQMELVQDLLASHSAKEDSAVRNAILDVGNDDVLPPRAA